MHPRMRVLAPQAARKRPVRAGRRYDQSPHADTFGPRVPNPSPHTLPWTITVRAGPGSAVSCQRACMPQADRDSTLSGATRGSREVANPPFQVKLYMDDNRVNQDLAYTSPASEVRLSIPGNAATSRHSCTSNRMDCCNPWTSGVLGNRSTSDNEVDTFREKRS